MIPTTKLIEILNIRNRGGRLYSKTGFSRRNIELLKLIETKGKIKKEEAGAQYFTNFDGLIKDGYIRHMNGDGLYELTEDGKNEIMRLKKKHKVLYGNIKL